jgi:hypothetical protein
MHEQTEAETLARMADFEKRTGIHVVRDGHAFTMGPSVAGDGRERFAAEHGAEVDARKALGLVHGEPDPARVATELVKLFSAVSELLALPGDLTHISPDAKKEWAALVGRVRRAILDDRTSDKRRRTYLENRIIRQAAHCQSGSATNIGDTCQRIVSLTVDDVHTEPLAEKLSKHEAKLAAVVRAAVARKPKNGRFPPPGNRYARPAIDAYEQAFRELCEAIGVSVAEASTRASERSRMSHRATR